MRTNLPDVWAAGDCAETYHRLLDRPAYLPLGTTAHKQGRVAGENAVGGDRVFAGSLGTQVVKVFELAVARTGLRDDATDGGFDPRTVSAVEFDHKVYYPGAHGCACGSPATGEPAGCWGCSCSATATPRSPSGSTSPPPCFMGWRSRSSTTWT